MKATMVISPTTGDDGWINVQFPCAGYLENISFQVLKYDSGDVNDNNFALVFGDFDPDYFQDNTPLADGGNMTILPSKRDDMCIIRGLDFMSDPGDNSYYYFAHFGKKRIRIRHDKVYKFGIFGKEASIDFQAILQASFRPYDNAYFKMTQVFDGITAANNFNTQFFIPTSLRTPVLEYDIYVENASELASKIIPRIVGAYNDFEGYTNTDILSGSGVIDLSQDPTGDHRYGGTIDEILISAAAAGLATKEGYLQIRDNLIAGDKIAFDIVDLHSTGTIASATGKKFTFTIHGKVKTTKSRFKSQFLASNQIAQPFDKSGGF